MKRPPRIRITANGKHHWSGSVLSWARSNYRGDPVALGNVLHDLRVDGYIIDGGGASPLFRISLVGRPR